MSDSTPAPVNGPDRASRPGERSPAPLHPSLEKTVCQVGEAPPMGIGGESRAAPPGATEVPAPPSESSPDVAFLRDQFARQKKERAVVQRTVDQLRTQLDALRSDFSVQRNDYLAEIRTLNELLTKTNLQTRELEASIADLKASNKQLKAQNLNLQYHLNRWGIPVSSGEDSREESPGNGAGKSAFFPVLSPLAGGEDPIPVTLRGDLTALYFPDLLHFVANSKLTGVVTIVADGIISKLYLEGPVLRLAGWNHGDPALQLVRLLEESELVPPEICRETEGLGLFDFEAAVRIVEERRVPVDAVRHGLKEHARVILGYLLQLKRGAFFFQPGQIARKRDLQFRLLITDVLLKTAAEMDEKTRVLGASPGEK